MSPPIAAPPVLEVYYSSTCAPCRVELPAVAEFAKQNGARVQIVIVSDEARARNEIRTLSPALEAVAVARVTASPGAVLRAAGDENGILPYARSLTPSGAICARWLGRLSLAKAGDLVAACVRRITSPR